MPTYANVLRRTENEHKTDELTNFNVYQKKGLHYINTPKQLILNFDDCINDNFNVKIDRFVVVFLGSKRNRGYIHNLFLSKKEEKGVFPRLKPRFTI